MVNKVVSTRLEKVVSNHLVKNQNLMRVSKEVVNDFMFTHVKQLRRYTEKLQNYMDFFLIYLTVKGSSALRSTDAKIENGFELIFVLKYMVINVTLLVFFKRMCHSFTIC